MDLAKKKRIFIGVGAAIAIALLILCGVILHVRAKVLEEERTSAIGAAQGSMTCVTTKNPLVTKDNYLKITGAMTLGDVEALLGPCDVTKHTTSNTAYTWVDAGNMRVICIEFAGFRMEKKYFEDTHDPTNNASEVFIVR